MPFAQRAPFAASGVTLSLFADSAPGSGLLDRIGWTRTQGYGGIVLDVRGTPDALHAPSVSSVERDRLRAATEQFEQVALLAPTQDTFDVTLVSPSSAIRRASLAELWSVCRLAGMLSDERRKTLVLVRAGVPPQSLPIERHREYLRESLHQLNKTAEDQNCLVALWNRDYFTDPEDFGLLEMLPSQNLRAALDLRPTFAQEEEAALSNFLRWGEKRVALLCVSPQQTGADLLARLAWSGMLCHDSPALPGEAVQYVPKK